VLSRSERRQFAAVPELERAGRFLERWVLKEAYAKALGEGLACPFGRISFSRSGTAIAVDDARVDPAESARWAFALRRPRPSHVLALALRRASAGERVEIRTVDLGATAHVSDGPARLSLPHHDDP
jgi:4'-phosphopantetheinyl transferase